MLFYQIIVVLLGEGCVGKTSCVLRYVEDTFRDKHLSTLQASFLKKTVNIRDKSVTLCIWDTAGQERFHALGPIYYRDAQGAILVYDITDEDSFQKVKTWVRNGANLAELRKMLGNDITLVIAGNKVDLEKKRIVGKSQAEEYASSVGAKHFNTSAKLNKGIEEMFHQLGNQLVDTAERDAHRTGNKASAIPRRGGKILLVDDSQEEKSKANCCK